MSDDLCFASATDLGALIRSRTLSPVELLNALLDHIDRHNNRVNAFANLTVELAREMAREAERSLMANELRGPLHGVPATIKDLHDLKGHPIEQGSRSQVGKISDADSPVTARLKAAGAVILGKTTTSEFGWSGVSRSPLTGATHNPWKHGYNAGASSAGAGVAAAAGFGPLHQGSDGAGSIRMPSHFCGVFGFKPTWGLVPHLPVRNNDQVSHVGPPLVRIRSTIRASSVPGPTTLPIWTWMSATFASPSAPISVMPGSTRRSPGWSARRCLRSRTSAAASRR